MLIALLAATILMADAAAAPAAQAPDQAAPAAAAAPPPVEPPKKATVVCRNEPSLGSRVPTKKCRTPEQIAAQKAADQDDLERLQRTRANPGQ